MSRYEKKIVDKLDDDIKLAGLESLVPEELEKHLILNSSRLRTFEDARLKVATYVEAKLGLRNRDSKPSDTSTRGHSDPMDVDAVNAPSSVKGKGSSSPRDGCFKCGGAHFQRDCNARKGANNVWQRQTGQVMVQERALDSQAKVEVKRASEDPTENPKCEPRCQRLTQGQNIESWSLRS